MPHRLGILLASPDVKGNFAALCALRDDLQGADGKEPVVPMYFVAAVDADEAVQAVRNAVGPGDFLVWSEAGAVLGAATSAAERCDLALGLRVLLMHCHGVAVVFGTADEAKSPPHALLEALAGSGALVALLNSEHGPVKLLEATTSVHEVDATDWRQSLQSRWTTPLTSISGNVTVPWFERLIRPSCR